jgi:hypothetical protein
VRLLALGLPLSIAFSAILLFAAAVVVMYTFKLVGHAKSLAADAKAAGERVQRIADELQDQVKLASDRASSLGGDRAVRGSKRKRGV